MNPLLLLALLGGGIFLAKGSSSEKSAAKKPLLPPKPNGMSVSDYAKLVNDVSSGIKNVEDVISNFPGWEVDNKGQPETVATIEVSDNTQTTEDTQYA